MIFNNVKALHQLLSNGIVFTFRTKKQKNGIEFLESKVRVPFFLDNVRIPSKTKVAVGKVRDVYDYGDLEGYVEESGFEHSDEWVEAIRNFHPSIKLPRVFGKKKVGTLYVVIRL